MLKCRWSKFFAGRFVAGLFFLSVTAAPTALFAYDEDTADDDPTAISITSALAQKRDKSPAVVLLKTREELMPRPVLPKEKTLIREVLISGAFLLADEEILALKQNNQNKELTGREMQRIVDRINRAYSREGYITSYAYVVPDRLVDGILEINVVEGKTGKIEIKGNKVFSTEVLKKKISLTEGGLFNFKQLNVDIFRINRSPDRKMSMVLEPDKVTGATNIILTVKERSPLHTSIQADNYGAQSIKYKRYKMLLTHNNITGHDDALTAKIELSDSDAHKIYDLDYQIPLSNNLRFQFYYMPYKVEDYYYFDNEDTDFEKRARKFYTKLYHWLVNEPGVELLSTYGFTYFDIFWYKPYLQYSIPSKKDKFRILSWNLALNRMDDYGRWVISNDLQRGIPEIAGGIPEKSDEGSVAGAKGDYVKDLITIARRQKLFAGIDFTSKARFQASSATLTGVNAFSTGGMNGVIDNRGYPRTQAPGDYGKALSLGFDFPAYFVPRTMNAPFALKTKMYDSLKFHTFWDWSQAILKSPDADQKKQTTLMSTGFGFVYSVPEQNLSMRLDCGFPLSKHVTPKDTDHTHAWWSVTKGF